MSKSFGRILSAAKEMRASIAPDANGWMPIETAIKASVESDGWIGPCLFGKMREWGWETWVGQCDDGYYWLSRDGTGSCDETDSPTHWQHLPKPPVQP